MNDKIDIHGVEKAYESSIKSLNEDTSIIKENKELIQRFIYDCELGKTIKGRAKKKIGKQRITKYILYLRKFSNWLNKPFDKVEQEDMEKIIYNLEKNVYKSMKNTNYSEETKIDYKKSLKKFYKWLLGNNTNTPEIVDWIDLTPAKTYIPAFNREQVEKVVSQSPELWQKALIMILFDGGFRIEELLNVRIKDIEKRKYNDNDSYWIDIRYSKTKERKIPLILSNTVKCVDDYLETHSRNPEEPLFDKQYRNLLKHIQRLFMKILKQKVTFHQLRHSSATYWANKLTRYQLCYRFGWSMSSDSPDRYIDRQGIHMEEIAQKGDVDSLTKLQRRIEELEFRQSMKDSLFRMLIKDEVVLNVIEERYEGDERAISILKSLKHQP